MLSGSGGLPDGRPPAWVPVFETGAAHIAVLRGFASVLGGLQPAMLQRDMDRMLHGPKHKNRRVALRIPMSFKTNAMIPVIRAKLSPLARVGKPPLESLQEPMNRLLSRPRYQNRTQEQQSLKHSRGRT
jgi:hypothetical protein